MSMIHSQKKPNRLPTIVRVLLFLLIYIGSAVALFCLLPLLKEGYDIEHLPFFAGVAGGLLLTVWIWLRLGTGRLRSVGVGLLILALAPYLFLCGKLVVNEWRGRHIGRQIRITRLNAHPIEWPNFDGPVGVRLEIELEHPVIKGILHSPNIAMTGRLSLSRRDHFYWFFQDCKLGFLASPLFNPLSLDAVAPFEQPRPTLVVYDLYPGTVRRTQGVERICVSECNGALPIIYADGPELLASWWFMAQNGAWTNLSDHLTEQIQALPMWRGAMDWTAMHKRLEPNGLRKAGYTSCADREMMAGEICFCR